MQQGLQKAEKACRKIDMRRALNESQLVLMKAQLFIERKEERKQSTRNLYWGNSLEQEISMKMKAFSFQ